MYVSCATELHDQGNERMTPVLRYRVNHCMQHQWLVIPALSLSDVCMRAICFMSAEGWWCSGLIFWAV
jgi:hypothetical protein